MADDVSSRYHKSSAFVNIVIFVILGSSWPSAAGTLVRVVFPWGFPFERDNLLFCWSCHVSPLLWSYVWKVTNIMGCSLFIVQLPCARSLFLRTVVPVRWLPWNLSIITDPILLVHIIHFPESVWWWCCTPESWGRRMGEDKGVWGEGGRSKGMQLHTGK